MRWRVGEIPFAPVLFCVFIYFLKTGRKRKRTAFAVRWNLKKRNQIRFYRAKLAPNGADGLFALFVQGILYNIFKILCSDYHGQFIRFPPNRTSELENFVFPLRWFASANMQRAIIGYILNNCFVVKSLCFLVK